VLMDRLIASYQALLEDIYLFFFYYRFAAADETAASTSTSADREEDSVRVVATEDVQTRVGDAVRAGIDRCNAMEKELCDVAGFGMLIQQSDSMFALVTILSSKI
jgi:hypothetical protein